jgi:hypothetical protein
VSHVRNLVKIQAAPASMLHPIIKPWMFRGWALDFMVEIHPSSTKGHHFMLVAIDYFMKWVEVSPLKNMTHREVISFMLEHIIYRFDILQTLLIDQEVSFMSHQFREFAAPLKIKLLNLSPYYALDEASNKILIRLIKKKKIEERPSRCHEVLSMTLWAYRVSKHGVIKVTPSELVYGQEVVLPVEVNVQACKLMLQETLFAIEYESMMMDEVDDLPESQLVALREIEKEKLRVAKAYNRRDREKSFQFGDLVWKTISPLGSQDNRFGKWSSSWEGPHKVVTMVP